MAPQRPEDGFVRMPEHEFEAIVARAAEEGAKRALADVGLEGDEAAREAGHSEHGNTALLGEAMEVG